MGARYMGSSYSLRATHVQYQVGSAAPGMFLSRFLYCHCVYCLNEVNKEKAANYKSAAFEYLYRHLLNLNESNYEIHSRGTTHSSKLKILHNPLYPSYSSIPYLKLFGSCRPYACEHHMRWKVFLIQQQVSLRVDEETYRWR